MTDTFQIPVPDDVVREQGWKPGQTFAFVRDGSTVRVVPVPTFEELRGIARGADASDHRDRNDRY